jgi:hypothetical protein
MRMLRYSTIVVLIMFLACTGGNREVNPPESATPLLVYTKSPGADSTLADQYNTHVPSEYQRVKRFTSTRVVPSILPQVQILDGQFESSGGVRPLAVCFDSEDFRFFLLTRQDFDQEFNLMMSGRFQEIGAGQALTIGALAVMLKESPRMIISRPADLYLARRLRAYMNDSFIPDSTNWSTLFSNGWWAWNAFPSANSQYQKFFQTYQDSIKEADFLRDIPDDAITPPHAEKVGIYWEVQFCGLPAGVEAEIVRYVMRIADNGRLHELSAEPVYYY